MQNSLKIKIKKLRENVIIPKYGHPGDAGLDLYSLEDVTLQPGKHVIINNGFSMEFPIGYAAIVTDKSSLSKEGIHTMGGVFDAGYRGEYNVHLVNLSEEIYQIENGDKIAQLIIYQIGYAELIETEVLGDSSRGVGRFGSTGKK